MTTDTKPSDYGTRPLLVRHDRPLPCPICHTEPMYVKARSQLIATCDGCEDKYITLVHNFDARLLADPELQKGVYTMHDNIQTIVNAINKDQRQRQEESK